VSYGVSESGAVTVTTGSQPVSTCKPIIGCNII
jgi:hypothetical protein